MATLALVACSAASDPRVTEFEYDRPAEPAPPEVLVVDWARASPVPLSVGQTVPLSFGGARYGVAQIESDVGPAEVALSISDGVDVVVWLVSPSRNVASFERGQSARALSFHPKEHGSYFLIMRDAHFAEGQATVSVARSPSPEPGRPKRRIDSIDTAPVTQ
jgi:hypothetical protein